jgi:hypothetical protein
MKSSRYVLVVVLGFIACLSVARADSDSDSPEDAVKYDRDGVPLAILQPKAPQLTPDQIATIRKEQAQAALDKDWLVRGYEKQLQLNSSGKPGGDQSSNLYYQISTDKELARLAGLPLIDDSGADGTSGYRTSDAHSANNDGMLRSPAASPAANLQAGAFLKPFITPIGAPDAAGLPNFYSSLGGSAAAPFSGAAAQLSGGTPGTPDEDPADIETPGMIAAEKNPNPNTLDLSLDVLPDESIEHARDHQDNDELLALPLPPDADQLRHAQAAALNPQGLPGAPQPAATTQVPAKPIPINEDDAPVPASKQPVINPVRAPIANPFDILNR